MSSKQHQIEAVQKALLAGDPVDQVEAIRRGWGLRLGALIHRLRGRGWPIITRRDHNNGLARYRLREGWAPLPDNEDAKPPETKRPRRARQNSPRP